MKNRDLSSFSAPMVFHSKRTSSAQKPPEARSCIEASGGQVLPTAPGILPLGPGSGYLPLDPGSRTPDPGNHPLEPGFRPSGSGYQGRGPGRRSPPSSDPECLGSHRRRRDQPRCLCLACMAWRFGRKSCVSTSSPSCWAARVGKGQG